MLKSTPFVLRLIQCLRRGGWRVAAPIALCAIALLLTAGAAQAVERTPFDHLTTGFELLGEHRDLPCESCHVNAIFKGTPKDCASCHGVGTAVRATAKPANHILTSNLCDACHTPVAWNPAVNFDHNEVQGSCSSCHNNVQAQGMGPNHIVTDLQCDVCHSTIGWAGAVFTHLGVTSGCNACHNGAGATGPPADHVPIGPLASAQCESCHTPTNYTSWHMINATATSPPGMVHAAVSASCSTCHEAGLSWAGVPATVLRPQYLVPANAASGPHPTTGECSTCHLNTVSFLGAAGLPTNHIPLPAADGINCSLCHATTDYTMAVMNHVNISSNCNQCHAAGLSFAGVWTTPLKAPPSNHVPIGSADCGSCHSPSTFTSFVMSNASGSAPPAMVHSAVPGVACATCHAAGLSFVGVPATKTPPANHIPFAGAACETCHSPTTFSAFTMTNGTGTAPPAMVHSAVASLACSTCHEAGLTWAGAPPTVVRPVHKVPTDPTSPLHVTTGECSDCHLNTTSFLGATDYPANHIPLPSGGSSNCTACHTNPANYATYAMDHSQVAGTACAACHGAGKSFSNMAPPMLKEPPANHVPIGSAACESCHAANVFTSFVMTNASGTTPPSMVHTAVPGVACATCHGAGLSWVGTPATKVLPANHVPIGTAACESCHAPTNFATFVMTNASGATPPSMVHTAVAGVACATCHGAGKTWVGTPATKVPPGNHVPIGAAACESCHAPTNFATFVMTNASGTAPPAMVHSAVPGVACATCHAAGLSFVGTPATKAPPANHIPFGTAACESCHSATTFTAFTFTNATGTAPPAMVHSVVSSLACSTCHEAGLTWVGTPATVVRPQYLVPGNSSSGLHPTTGECSNCHLNTVSFLNATLYPPNHIPNPGGSGANCANCHTTGDYTAYVMSHAGIAANGCAACHAAGLTFSGVWATPLKAPPANHVPFGSADCGLCHSPTTFTTFQMTNASGTAPPAMVHSAVPGVACATCHAAGQSWVGTPSTKAPPANHVPFIGAACESCHSATTFTAFTFTNATGTAAPAMVHSVVSALSCATCHEAGLTWVGTPATVVRPQYLVPGNASSGLHPTTGDCSQCHLNTTSFLGAVSYPANHIPNPGGSSATCTNCHTTGDYSVYVMSHAGITSNCSACHAAGLTFAGVWTSAPMKVPPGNHVPFGSADCGACHSPSVFTSFAMTNASGTAPPAMVHSAVSGVTCATCHAAGKSWVGTPATKVLPANHVPVGSAACETCHTPTNFTSFAFSNASGTAPAAMVHTAVAGVACATCHAAGLSFVGTPATKALPANHVPVGSAACETCHTPTNFTSFAFTNASGTAPPAMVHTAVSGVACATCHAAGLSFVGTPATKGPPANHVPFGSAACEGCHSGSTFTTFAFSNKTGTAPPAMVHSLVSSTACSSCHEAGKSWVGTPATVVRPQYLVPGNSGSGLHPTTGECSQCHLNTTSFLGAVSYPSGHIPNPGGSSATCTNCHTTGDYSVYVMSHTGITNNCAQCHAYGLSFAGVWTAKALVAPPSGATGHIPSNPPNGTLTITCESCHSATNFTTFSGTVMKHAFVTTMTCESCHELGMKWKTNTGVKLWVRDSANHHAGQDCGGSGCHNSRDKRAVRRTAVGPNGQVTAVARATTALGGASVLNGTSVLGGTVGFDHRRVAATPCVSCHSAASGTGKPAGHIASSNSCQNCHSTVTWMPVTAVDHTQVIGTCVSCHNGAVAKGKGSSHIPSGTDCQTCHTTNAWTPARFDHSAVAPHTCRSCHDAIHATGLPANHVVSAAQCDTCHGTLSWTPATLDHTTLTHNCVSCHNNRIALGLSPTHLSTALDCAVCHSYPDWTMLHFVHTAANYPGTHAAALTCASCHTSNTDQIPWPAPAEAGSCAGCHAPAFTAGHHPKTSGGLQYTVGELRNCTGACHVYSDATLGTLVKAVPGPYHRVSDVAFKH